MNNSESAGAASVVPGSVPPASIAPGNASGSQMPPSFAPRRSPAASNPADGIGNQGAAAGPAFSQTATARQGGQTGFLSAQTAGTGAGFKSPSTGQNAFSAAASTAKSRKKGPRRVIAAVLVLVLIAVICWPLYLSHRANSQLGRVAALSGANNSQGTTYLFVGSDSRDGYSEDSTIVGERSDSIILVHKAENGQTAMVSLPRDTYVEIPGYGMNKINASVAYGGAELLVQTVEQLTGLTVDHYIQIGMGGVGDIVDALGGVELCLDYDVDDEKSGLVWEAGCHLADGDTALAFSRMRYSDPLGDIGRGERQRQVLNAVASSALSWSLLVNPVKQVQLVDSGSLVLTVDDDSSVFDVARVLLALREAAAAGLSGTPPIASMGYSTPVGSVVLLEESTVDDFFARLASGSLTEADFESTL